MPSEMRRLTFSREELITALTQHYQASPDRLPEGRIVDCTLIARPKALVRLQVLDPSNNGTHAQDMPLEHVAAALLRYCMNHRIPVPKRSRKSIEIVGDSLCLDIRIGAHPTPLPGAASSDSS